MLVLSPITHGDAPARREHPLAAGHLCVSATNARSDTALPYVGGKDRAMNAQKSHRFTRIAVRLGVKSSTYTVVYPELKNGRVIGIVPGFGTEFVLKPSMLAITAGQQSSDATKVAEQGGSLYSIKVSDVKEQRKQTVIDLFKRNPWNNENATLFVAALTK